MRHRSADPAVLLPAVRDAVAVTREAPTLHALLEGLHRALARAMDVESFYVALYDDATGLYSFPYSIDEDDDDFTPQELKKSLTDFVRRTGAPMRVTEPEHAKLRAMGEVEVVGVPSPVWIGAPLRTGRGVIGVAVVQSYLREEAYGPEDLAALSLLSDIVAPGVEPLWERRGGEATARTRERQLVLDRDEALRASRAKSTFLANMSHELRTPLNAILGYSELIAEQMEDGGRADLADLGHIREASRHLLRLIEDVLDLSRIEAGRLDVVATAFPFAAIAEGAADLARPAAVANGSTLVVKGADAIGELVTDATKLQQVLLNLLTNAARFTRNGSIVLRAKRDGALLHVDVADTGIGIPPDRLESMFEPFVQGDETATREVGGTGLGLAITRDLCRLLGGDVTAKSVPGAGSTFTVRIPASIRPSSGA